MNLITWLQALVLSSGILMVDSTQGATLYGGGFGQRTMYTIDATNGARTVVKDFNDTTFPGINGLAFNSMEGFLYATTTYLTQEDEEAASKLYRMGVTDQSFDAIPINGLSPLRFLSSITGLEYDSTRNVFWATLLPERQLLQITADTFTATVIGTMPPFTAVAGLAYDAQTDTLYGVDDFTNAPTSLSRLVIIDKNSAALTSIGPAGLGQSLKDLDSLAFNPTDRMLYSVNDQGNLFNPPYAQQLVRIDPATGLATLVGPPPQVVIEEFYQGLAFVVPEPPLLAMAAAVALGARCKRLRCRRRVA
jgi:DNA-binding beta-propeller fold protein YncE